MKKVFFFFIFLAPALMLKAQLTPAQQKQLEAAQKKLQQLQNDPAIQQKIKQAQQQLDKIKADTAIAAQMNKAKDALKQHPEAGNVTLPDLNSLNAGIPNMDSLNASITAQMSNTQNKMRALEQIKKQSVPKPNPLNHAEALAKLKRTTLLAFATATLNSVSPALDVVIKSNLDKIVKDGTLNAAGTGLFYLSLNLSPKEACAYLICKGILLQPGDPYAVNALGVYYRDNNDLENALQLFLYADALLPDSLKSPYIYANIGWASFYYGDFTAAQKYFDKSLAISSEFKTALEGEAMIAYAKGDIQALFKCLTKELLANTKYAGGGGGNESAPSETFTDIAATEYIQNVKNLDEQPDPTQDNSLDVFEDEEAGDGGADGEDVSFEIDAKPIFNVDPKTLIRAKGAAARFQQKAFSIMQPFAKNLTQQLSGLTPLVSGTTIDNGGNIIVSKSYRKYVDFISEARRLFERRIYWFRKKYLDEYNPFPVQWQTAMQDKINLFMKEMGNCSVKNNYCNGLTGDALDACKARIEKCTNEAKCKWYPVLYGECNSDIEASARIWNKYWDNIAVTIQWYINVTNPLIRKVHDAGWNSYLNNARIADIKRTVLSAYSDWAVEVLAVPVDPFAGEEPPSCPVEIAGIEPPNPFSKKPKHIKQYEEKCDDFEYGFENLGMTSNCHYLKFHAGGSIGPAKLGLSYTTVTDKGYAENHGYTHAYGTSAELSQKVGSIVNVSGSLSTEKRYNDNGDLTGSTKTAEASASADLKAATVSGKVSQTCQYDGQGNLLGYSNNVSGSAGVTGAGNAELSSSSSYDKYGNYTGGNFQLTTTSSAIAAYEKFTGNASNAGVIQANQAIQVVAGQIQTSPITAQVK